jgi:hypothetical protein
LSMPPAGCGMWLPRMGSDCTQRQLHSSRTGTRIEAAATAACRRVMWAALALPSSAS